MPPAVRKSSKIEEKMTDVVLIGKSLVALRAVSSVQARKADKQCPRGDVPSRHARGPG
jgi:hypothetical protein